MMAAIPRTWCCKTKFRLPEAIGMVGAVQTMMAGAKMPMRKKKREAAVRAKRTGRTRTLRTSAITVTM